MKISEIDKKLDDYDEGILQHLDTSKVRMLNKEHKQNYIDFPARLEKKQSTSQTYDFDPYADMWSGRDLMQEDLREKAWK